MSLKDRIQDHEKQAVEQDQRRLEALEVLKDLLSRIRVVLEEGDLGGLSFKFNDHPYALDVSYGGEVRLWESCPLGSYVDPGDSVRLGPAWAEPGEVFLLVNLNTGRGVAVLHFYIRMLTEVLGGRVEVRTRGTYPEAGYRKSWWRALWRTQ